VVAVGLGMKTWDIGELELHSLMNPSSCCFMLMGGLGYGEHHKSTCIHHAVCQQYRLVVGLLGVFSWHTLGLLIKVEQHLNAMEYVNIIAANQMHPFTAAVYRSAN
jgi:hypothetical protein